MSGPYYINPLFLSNGMHVWVCWSKEKDCFAPGRSTAGLRCEVVEAAGDAAVVENKTKGFRQLVLIEDLWVPPDYMQPGASRDKVFPPLSGRSNESEKSQVATRSDENQEAPP